MLKPDDHYMKLLEELNDVNDEASAWYDEYNKQRAIVAALRMKLQELEAEFIELTEEKQGD